MKKFLVTMLVLSMIFSLATVSHAGETESNKEYLGMVDVETHEVYVNAVGKHKPTVVFVSGYGDTNEVWEAVQAELALDFATISYDRAGLGQSTNNDFEKNVLEQVAELRAVLNSKDLGHAKVKKPYVLVGHSAGAYIIKQFTAMYPNEVAGIVLVDGTSEYIGDDLEPLLPAFLQEMMNASMTSEGNHDTMMASSEIIKASLENLDLGSMPIKILTAINPLGFDFFQPGLDAQVTDVQIEMQGRFLDKTTNGEQILVESGHYIHLENPSVVIEAIRDVASK